MSGQLVDATIVAAPKQRNTKAEKQALREGRIPQGWAEKPAQPPAEGPRCPLDGEVHQGQTRPGRRGTAGRHRDPGLRATRTTSVPSTPPADPALDRDRCCGACRGAARRAARSEQHGGGGLADTGYRSKKNEALLKDRRTESHIHRKKPRGRPLPINVARANGRRSAIRAPIEHIFACQKDKMGLFIRTIGLARATTKVPASPTSSTT